MSGRTVLRTTLDRGRGDQSRLRAIWALPVGTEAQRAFSHPSPPLAERNDAALLVLAEGVAGHGDEYTAGAPRMRLDVAGLPDVRTEHAKRRCAGSGSKL